MHVTALLYHDVVPGDRYEVSGFQSADANIYKFSAAEFARHLGAIARQSKSGPQLLDDSTAPQTTENVLAITFDDGGLGATLHTVPLLAEYGWPGYFFMTTDFIDTPGFMSGADLRAVHAAGHVIGSHSCSHPPRMAACTASQLEREWKDSVRRLEDILGAPVTTASIPGGYYSRKVALAAGLAGIETLFTSEPVTRLARVEGVTTVGRFSVQQGVSADWVERLIAGEQWPRLSRYVTWNGKKVLKAIGGPLWLQFRKRVLAARARRETLG